MKIRERPRVTMAVIAREAGVSVPTVSKVLNGRRDVAAETRQRVEEVIRERNYLRRAARPQRSAGLLDLVFERLDNPWALEVIRGVEEAAHTAGAGVVISATHGQSRATRQWLQQLAVRRSDGVILVLSDLTRSQKAQLDLLGVPFAVIDPVGQPEPEIPSVGATNWAGGLAATEHLIGLGHRRIAFIGGPRRLLCSRARLDGYRSALEAARLPLDPDLIRAGEFDHETGFNQAVGLLELAEPPTAIFAGSDGQAFGAYEAVRRHGLRIPHDISVVGFDDVPVSRWMAPPLTTVRQPLAEMGATATRTVLRLAAGEQPELLRVELATSLVVRESAAPPARH